MGNTISCVFSSDLPWPDVTLSQNDDLATVEWKGNKKVFAQVIRNGQIDGEPFRVDTSKFEFKLKPGSGYNFKIWIDGFEGCSCHVKTTKTIYTKPSVPNGVVAEFANGLNVTWLKTEEAVTYRIEVTCGRHIIYRHNTKFNPQQSECNANIGYKHFIHQAIPGMYTVKVSAENFERRTGEHHTVKRSFDGSLDVRYFILSKDEDIVIIFMVADDESTEKCMRKWEENYKVVDRVKKCLHLNYKTSYKATLVPVHPTDSPLTPVSPKFETIDYRDLINDGQSQIKFILIKPRSELYLELRVAAEEQSQAEVNHAFKWCGKEAEANIPLPTDVQIVPEQEAVENTNDRNQAKPDTVIPIPEESGNDSPYLKSNGNADEIQIQIHVFKKPGHVAISHCITDCDEIHELLQDGYRKVNDRPLYYSLVKSKPFQAILDCNDGDVKPYAPTIQPTELLKGQPVTQEFTCPTNHSRHLSMEYRLKQIHRRSFEYPFRVECYGEGTEGKLGLGQQKLLYEQLHSDSEDKLQRITESRKGQFLNINGDFKGDMKFNGSPVAVTARGSDSSQSSPALGHSKRDTFNQIQETKLNSPSTQRTKKPSRIPTRRNSSLNDGRRLNKE